MSERKVLNKYYPPDFDPSKIPRMKLPKNRQYTVRLMAPCNMRCKTCGEYIYKGKKFNARKEDVEDPRNTDYEIEAGATRNFMALKLAEEQAQREEDERKEEEATNPMKLLENRTQQSKNELELLESLEELKDLNRRQQSVDYDTMLSTYNDKEALKKLEEMQEEEDEKMVRSIYGSSNKVKRVLEEEIIEDVDNLSGQAPVAPQPPKKVLKCSAGTSSSSVSSAIPVARQDKNSTVLPNNSAWNKSVGIMRKGGLAGLVRKKGITSQSSSSQPSEHPIGGDSKKSSTNETITALPTGSKTKLPLVSNGLSLLGSYSDSGSESDS